ncbi:MAG: putative adenylate/guanylate cyclase [Paucimonas sp.]|jgi:class 3 adenylate cyclase|nr:putative adenylate/guanylate cyclase [Paucimonas sp.]
MVHTKAGKARLKELLLERNQYAERAETVDEEIRRLFERQVSVLVLDMCGFSNLTSRFGITHFLGMIKQMEDAACPAVQSNGGIVIKQEADNLFAVFPTAESALESALDIFRAFEAMNAVLPDERDLRGCIGIGWGKTLVIDDEDIFGDEVNIACRLGEDLAEESEILLTTAAHAALPLNAYLTSPVEFALDGEAVRGYRFERCIRPGKK